MQVTIHEAKTHLSRLIEEEWIVVSLSRVSVAFDVRNGRLGDQRSSFIPHEKRPGTLRPRGVGNS